jgi:serine O-acetyltransferase
MWSDLRADSTIYAALRYPNSNGAIRGALIWLRSPGLLALALHRARHALLLYRQRHGRTLTAIALKVPLTLARQLLIILCKIDVHAATVIAGGVYLSDRGQLVLGPERIGSGTMIHERVTIGVKAGENAGPVIGENVWIGPDCVIYGDISVGAGVTVLPGTVMSMNVPNDTVVGGNPATIVRRNFDNRNLRKTRSCNVDPH